MPLVSLDTHWKHQGVSKETSGMKWVNINYFLFYYLFISRANLQNIRRCKSDARSKSWFMLVSTFTFRKIYQDTSFIWFPYSHNLTEYGNMWADSSPVLSLYSKLKETLNWQQMVVFFLWSIWGYFFTSREEGYVQDTL